MHFGNFRKMPVKIGKDRKLEKASDAFWKTPGAFRQRSSSWRPLTESLPGVFRRASKVFYNFRSLPSSHGNCRSTCRHSTKFFGVLYIPFTLSDNLLKLVFDWRKKTPEHIIQSCSHLEDLHQKIWSQNTINHKMQEAARQCGSSSMHHGIG